jgi:predicted Zn-dependent protease
MSLHDTPDATSYAPRVTWNRRELLRGLGASTLLWTFGCGSAPVVVAPTSAPAEVTLRVRTWLRDAISRLAALYPSVHALAVARRRTTLAVDVVGSAVARARRDGVVLTVRDAAGVWREQVTSELTQSGILAAVRALGGGAKRGAVEFGPVPATPPIPRAIDDDELRNRVEALGRNDKAMSSRVVYAAALIDIEDAHVWSVSAGTKAAPGHDREQRLVRIRKAVTRAAWNGSRPVLCEAERAWTGGIDDVQLDGAAVMQATRTALELMTPGAFDDKVRPVVLDPSLAASLVDAGTRALLTSAAMRRPEVARRNALGATVGSPLISLVDDPTVKGAYGGYQFDDEGEPAAAITLIEAGRAVALLADRAGGGPPGMRTRGRRPGHVGAIEPSPSHLRVASGTATPDALAEEGLVLEGALGTVVDPGTGRVVVGASRARELKKGRPTGRVFADVELVGDLRALMQGVTGSSAEVRTTAFREEELGEPRWRSVTAPFLRTEGFVRARRAGPARRA